MVNRLAVAGIDPLHQPFSALRRATARQDQSAGSGLRRLMVGSGWLPRGRSIEIPEIVVRHQPAAGLAPLIHQFWATFRRGQGALIVPALTPGSGVLTSGRHSRAPLAVRPGRATTVAPPQSRRPAVRRRDRARSPFCSVGMIERPRQRLRSRNACSRCHGRSPELAPSRKACAAASVT